MLGRRLLRVSLFAGRLLTPNAGMSPLAAAGIGILHEPSMRSYTFWALRRFNVVECPKLEVQG